MEIAITKHEALELLKNNINTYPGEDNNLSHRSIKILRKACYTCFKIKKKKSFTGWLLLSQNKKNEMNRFCIYDTC